MTTDADRTVMVAEAFANRLCFICCDVLGDRAENSRLDTPATHVWITGAPKFLAVLLCQTCHRKWLHTAYSSPEHQQWPTAHYPLG